MYRGKKAGNIHLR